MDYRGMESEFGAGFQAAARKLLAGKGEIDPSPDPSASVCRDNRTGATVSCQNPHTLVIIIAGMSCMMLLVIIAMLLLCWSVARQRRVERHRRESGGADPTFGIASPEQANPAVAPVDSPKFDDAVFVQLPGDEKPQFFALPKPFREDDHRDVKTPAEVAEGGKTGEKEPSSEGQPCEYQSCEDQSNAVADDPCVPSTDGLYRNPR